MDIAKWSGRKDVSQNKVYDHQSDRDIVALVRETVGDELRMFGPLAKMHKTAMIPRDEFASLKIQTAHTTEFGYCIHDFSMLPCQIHGDCLNCDEQVCIKGDAYKEATRQALHAYERIQHAFALRKKALSEGGGVVPKVESPELQASLQRIARLEGENTRLEAENDRLLEQFATWAYNAHACGVSKERLCNPMPAVNRDQTFRQKVKPTKR